MHFSWTGWKHHRHSAESTFQINCSPHPSQKNLCLGESTHPSVSCLWNQDNNLTQKAGKVVKDTVLRNPHGDPSSSGFAFKIVEFVNYSKWQQGT